MIVFAVIGQERGVQAADAQHDGADRETDGDRPRPQKWLTNGIPGTYTRDGTHPQPAADIIMSRALRATLERMFPAIAR